MATTAAAAAAVHESAVAEAETAEAETVEAETAEAETAEAETAEAETAEAEEAAGQKVWEISPSLRPVSPEYLDPAVRLPAHASIQVRPELLVSVPRAPALAHIRRPDGVFVVIVCVCVCTRACVHVCPCV